MKNKLLVTTAALALMISAGANAQTRNETKPDQPAASQSQKEHGSTSKETTRGTDNAKGGTSTGATAAGTSDSKAASDTKSDASKPASAQNSSPSHSNDSQSSSKADDKSSDKDRAAASDKSSDKAADKGNAARQDDKSTASDRSKQANEPGDSKSNTAGQSDSKKPSAAQRDSTTDRNQAATKSKTDDANRNTADSKPESATHISASLKTEQKTRLHQAVTKLDVKPVTHVNFSVSVGTAVPRTVSLHPVPTTIVEIVPQYRGYDYFVVRDEVIIVHPETHKIVDVIERSGGSSHASVTTSREKRIKLSDKQRSYIREHATARRTTTTTTTTGSAPRHQTIVVGEEVPSSVEIEAFPADVYREVPTVREYRYIRSGGNVYLVDPGTRHVIEEIE